MDIETFLQSLFSLLKNSDIYFFMYAVATCLLTQIVKKIFVNKTKVDVLHKFDFAVVLPFLIGFLFAVLDAFVRNTFAFTFCSIVQIFTSTATIGALASVIFKLFSSLSGKNLKSLLSNDIFAVFYNQLLYFGTAKQRLKSGELSFSDFLEQVKLVADNAQTIYSAQGTAESKREKLYNLLSGIIDETDITACVNVINKALIAQNSQKTKS